MQLLQSEILSQFSKIGHYISTKPYIFRCPFYNGKNKNVSVQHKGLLAKELHTDEEKIVFLNQTHSTDIIYIGRENYTDSIYADATISNTPGIVLSVLTSDCVPILLYDEKEHAIGVIHAGWKGLIGNIIPATIQKMQTQFGSTGGSLVAYIGPCISQKNYEIGEDVKNEIPRMYEKFLESTEIKGKYFLDLRGMAHKQIRDRGVKEQNIEVSHYCTYDEDALFHSYRRKMHFGDANYGNNAYGIFLKELTK